MLQRTRVIQRMKALSVNKLEGMKSTLMRPKNACKLSKQSKNVRSRTLQTEDIQYGLKKNADFIEGRQGIIRAKNNNTVF